MTRRMPTLFVPHGGGPWPWVPAFMPQLARDYVPLRAYLEGLADTLPARPTAVVVVSAHWEAEVPTVLSSEQPPLYFDYYGFPIEAYRIAWRPSLAGHVRRLLEDAGIRTAADPRRGFDHGAFVPLKLAFPHAQVPTVQLSLDASYDPTRHLAIGRALAPLRERGVLIVGSGMSFENFRAEDVTKRSRQFDRWFQAVATAEPHERDEGLARWADAPLARIAHPHEEHLLPMMVAAGAAGSDRGRVTWSGALMGIHVSGVTFGGDASSSDAAQRRT